jgi:hypothetical protein
MSHMVEQAMGPSFPISKAGMSDCNITQDDKRSYLNVIKSEVIK